MLHDICANQFTGISSGSWHFPETTKSMELGDVGIFQVKHHEYWSYMICWNSQKTSLMNEDSVIIIKLKICWYLIYVRMGETVWFICVNKIWVYHCKNFVCVWVKSHTNPNGAVGIILTMVWYLCWLTKHPWGHLTFVLLEIYVLLFKFVAS